MSATEYEVIDQETGEVKSNGTAVARVQTGVARRDMVAGLLRPVARPQEILQAQEETRNFLAQALKPGRDYDTIPGTKKPTMLQPGAERSAAAYGLAPTFELIEKEIDHDRPIHYVKRSWKWGKQKGEKIHTEEPGQSEGLYRYVLRCRLIHRESGVVVGEGVGSCSSMESKYIDRPRDLENTVLKMAKKRAYVDAVLTTLGLHDQFTQDLEDNPQAFGLEEPAGDAPMPVVPAWEKTMPFGKSRGKMLGELTAKELEGAKKWCTEKDAQKFAPLIADIEATYSRLFSQTVAAGEATRKDDATEERERLNRKYFAMLAERAMGSEADRRAFQNRLFKDGLIGGESCTAWQIADYNVAIDELELVPLEQASFA